MPIDQYLVLFTATLLSYGWLNSPLRVYTSQLIGFLIAVHVTCLMLKKTSPQQTVFTINSIIFLTITLSGGFHSPLFFLLYFFAFIVAHYFDPSSVFVALLTILIFFMPEFITQIYPLNVLLLVPILFLFPLAFFFGKQTKQQVLLEGYIENLEEATRTNAKSIIQNIKQVLVREPTLSKETRASLQTAEKEAEILEEESQE